MPRREIPDWLYPYEGVGKGPRGVARGAVRVVVYAGGTVLLIGWLGVIGLALVPLLVGVVIVADQVIARMALR